MVKSINPTPVAWIRRNRCVTMATGQEGGWTMCFLLTADSEEEEVDDEDEEVKGDGGAVGHLTPLIVSGRSKS